MNLISKSEARNPISERNPNAESRSVGGAMRSAKPPLRSRLAVIFGLRISAFFRASKIWISDFGIKERGTWDRDYSRFCLIFRIKKTLQKLERRPNRISAALHHSLSPGGEGRGEGELRSPLNPPPSFARTRFAFTLLEVMIATAIFFTATFTILAIVSQSLRTAGMLTRNVPTPGMVASILSNTNKLEEGVASGDFEDIAPGVYPEYDWSSETLMYVTNGMFQMNIEVYRRGNLDSSATLLLYRPDSATGLSTRSRFR